MTFKLIGTPVPAPDNCEDGCAWRLIPAQDGAGADCSFYICAICDDERYPHEITGEAFEEVI